MPPRACTSAATPPDRARRKPPISTRRQTVSAASRRGNSPASPTLRLHLAAPPGGGHGPLAIAPRPIPSRLEKSWRGLEAPASPAASAALSPRAPTRRDAAQRSVSQAGRRVADRFQPEPKRSPSSAHAGNHSTARPRLTPRLTRRVAEIDQDGRADRDTGVHRTAADIVPERARDRDNDDDRRSPRILAVGYLLNQDWSDPGDRIVGMDYDDEIDTVVVRTERETEFEDELKKKTLTSACTRAPCSAI